MLAENMSSEAAAADSPLGEGEGAIIGGSVVSMITFVFWCVSFFSFGGVSATMAVLVHVTREDFPEMG